MRIFCFTWIFVINDIISVPVNRFRFSLIPNRVRSTDHFGFVRFYCPPRKLWESYVFSGVCLFTGKEGVSVWPLPMMHWDLTLSSLYRDALP